MAHLERILGPSPDGLVEASELLERASDSVRIEGRPLTAGLTSLAIPDHPFGKVFRCGDILREYRGDSHIAAWVTAGLTAIEIGLLTELYWGVPLRSYSRTRGWSDEQYDVAEDELRSRGMIDVAGAFTPLGRDLRERVEGDTDRQMEPVLTALADDAQALIDVLARWAGAVRAAKGYPAKGPQELAASAASS